MEDSEFTNKISERAIMLAESIHTCLCNMPDLQGLMGIYQQIEDPETLSDIYNYLFIKYDYIPSEKIPDVFESSEFFALASIEKYIRKPTDKNKKLRDASFAKVRILNADKKAS